MSEKSSSQTSQPEEEVITAEEAERLLLERLQITERYLADTMWELVKLYSFTGRQHIAGAYVERLISLSDDPEVKAACYLVAGELMEQIKDYESAIGQYSRAFSLEPMNDRTWYFIYNNLGYCLNHFGRYAEAEPYCRAAISINPLQFNAHKNLGVALEGQAQYSEAARCYITAVRANAKDPRALHHLENLVASHQEISLEIHDIFDQLRECRGAVTAAGERAENREE